MRTGEKMAMKKFHQMILKKKTKITKDEQGSKLLFISNSKEKKRYSTFKLH